MRNASISVSDTMLINVTSGPRIIYELRSQLLTDVNNNSPAGPSGYLLEQNYPNPWNPSTLIKYSIPGESKVVMKIYNSLGQEVALLKDEIASAGNYQVEFNSGHLSSGVYFYRLTAESVDGNKKYSSMKKMILLK